MADVRSRDNRFFPHVAEPIPDNAVLGPGVSTDRAIATWNGITGTLLRDNPNDRILVTESLIMDAVGSYISLGVLPATTGIIRIPWNTEIRMGLGDFRFAGVRDANNNIYYGDSLLPGLFLLTGNSPSSIFVRNAGVNKFSVTSVVSTNYQSVVVTSGNYCFVIGSGFRATTGDLRITASHEWFFRNGLDTADISFFYSSSNRLYLGGTTAQLVQIIAGGPSGDTIQVGATEQLRTNLAGYSDHGVSLVMAAAKALDCSTYGGYLKPRRVSQASIPTPASGELLIWHDSDSIGDDTWLVYNDPTYGVCSVQMLP